MNVTQLHEAVGGVATDDSLRSAASAHRDQGGETNVLMVALDAAIPAEVPEGNILVVAPALNAWLRRWLSDEDAARRRAQERAAAFLEWLERNGVRAEGRVGDADPLLAIADALPMFPADAIVIAAEPEFSGWLADELASRARDRFGLPVFRIDESPARAAA